MDEEYEIVWTLPAERDLEAIARYIAQRNPTAAARLVKAIVAEVSRLRAFPYLGSAYPPGSTSRNRELIYRKYRIFYRVVEAARRVEVLTVWHSARREPRLPD
jgi:toxin ParE1/3/4